MEVNNVDNKVPIFCELNADDSDNNGCTEIESLCMNCHKNGVTRILLTKIPHYKELVLMSFTCENCGYENNEIQSGGSISDKGIRITLKVNDTNDLNRQLIRSDYTNVKIPDVDLEIPSQSQKGDVTTIEGLIDRTINGLRQDQTIRSKEHPDVAQQIDEFIAKLNELKTIEEPFTLIVEDISGNSHVENRNAPKIDPDCHVQYFKRTKEQDHQLGIFTRDEVNDDVDEAQLEVSTDDKDGILQPINEDEFTLDNLHGEVLQFPTNCNSCGSPCETNMKVTKIPHFKEVIIMATVCEYCGNKTNEVKSGSGIEEKGLRLVIKVRGKIDFSRDILKSETCSLTIPELELEVGPRALGGRFTTVEGLLIAVKEQLSDGTQSHVASDSRDPIVKERYDNFLTNLDRYLDGSKQFTLILDDPTGNSYVQSLTDDDDTIDDSLNIEHYDRTYEQNEDLGLNDMKTENYE